MTKRRYEIVQKGDSKECYYEFVKMLHQPFSIVKQYFEPLILKIDYYHDLKFFHEHYVSQNDKNQDTIYHNLSRLYDFLQNDSERDLKDFRFSFKAKEASIFKKDWFSQDGFEDFMKENADVMEHLSHSIEKSKKISLLTNMLNTCDHCQQSRQSISNDQFKMLEINLQNLKQSIENEIEISEKIQCDFETWKKEKEMLEKCIEEIQFQSQIRVFVFFLCIFVMVPFVLNASYIQGVVKWMIQILKENILAYILFVASVLYVLIPTKIKGAFMPRNNKKENNGK